MDIFCSKNRECSKNGHEISRLEKARVKFTKSAPDMALNAKSNSPALPGRIEVLKLRQNLPNILIDTDGLPLDFLRVEVGNRIAVGRASQPHGFPGHILETLDQRGLTISTMAQQADVSDILYGIRHR